MLEKNEIESALKQNPQQRQRIHPVIMGVLMGLSLLLVRLIFKETTFGKKQPTEKLSRPPASFTNKTTFSPPYAGAPVGKGEMPSSVQTPSFPSPISSPVGESTLLYPSSDSTQTLIAPPSTLDVTHPETNEWQGDPLLEAEVAETTETATNWRALGREFAETIVLTLLIFLIMRALVQNYRIEGYSMEPNLHQQQYLIVNKVAYYLGEPERGDIIVFEYPYGPETDYIKRVIGVPGDTVECRPNEILVNGQIIDEPYNPNPWTYTCVQQTLGENEYFVLGDNRSQSSDSHKWGAVERKFIIGKAWISYWPIDTWGRVANYQIEAPEPKEPLAQTQ